MHDHDHSHGHTCNDHSHNHKNCKHTHSPKTYTSTPETADHEFVHLHVHTEYSLLDGINKVNRLPSQVKTMNQPALAMTDHGNISGSYRFYKECNKVGIKPILGMEAYYTVGDRTVREPDELGNSYYHLILLAQNNIGLHNLMKLSSYAYTEGMYRKPRIDDALIAQYSEGIIATTTCLGSRASQLILQGEKKQAEKLIHHHRSIFQDRFIIELQTHRDEEQMEVNKVLQKIALENNFPVILTNDCHYPSEHDKDHHEAALCMQTKTTLSNEKRFTFGEIKVHVADGGYMWNEARYQGMPYDVISNTVHLANMIDSDSYFMDRMNRYPKYQELPPEYTSIDFLTIEAQHGLFNRFKEMPPVEYRKRLDYELNVIKKMGFADYLLIVAQFMNGAKERGVVHGPGRGSAAGSLIAWSLGITEVDPVKYGLLFSRFLNEGRGATPLIFNKQMALHADSVKLPF
jgi:DNA polymerase-3 subunit alpha